MDSNHFFVATTAPHSENGKNGNHPIARIEPGLKTEVESILLHRGLTTSEAIHRLCKQIKLQRGGGKGGRSETLFLPCPGFLQTYTRILMGWLFEGSGRWLIPTFDPGMSLAGNPCHEEYQSSRQVGN